MSHLWVGFLHNLYWFFREEPVYLVTVDFADEQYIRFSDDGELVMPELFRLSRAQGSFLANLCLDEGDYILLEITPRPSGLDPQSPLIGREQVMFRMEPPA
jgi:hypothetical protein